MTCQKTNKEQVYLYRCQYTKAGTVGTLYVWAANPSEAEKLAAKTLYEYSSMDIREITVPTGVAIESRR